MIALLVDNSNTRTKFILADGKTLLGEKKILLTADITETAVHHLLMGWKYDFAIISSVVPACIPALEAGIRKPCHVLNAQSPHGVSLASYPDYDHLGADRLSNVLALKDAPHFPAIAVDLGTAVTYDILVKTPDGQHCFIGGAIAPGLKALKTCLSERTALLPVVDECTPAQWIGKNTSHALQSGVLLGFVGMVRETLSSLSKELGGDPYIILTGGDAALIAKELAQPLDIDPELTLKGLLELSKCPNLSFFTHSC